MDNSLLERFIIALQALCEIQYSEGKVCKNFADCKHESCRSSYSSWAIANKAIQDINIKNK